MLAPIGKRIVRPTRERCGLPLVWLIALVCAINVSILCNTLGFVQVEARYLPTRADETEIGILKEIIRNLMDKSRFEQLLDAESLKAATHRAGQNYQPISRNSDPHDIERRSTTMRTGGEIPQAMLGGEELPPKSLIDATNRRDQFYSNALRTDG